MAEQDADPGRLLSLLERVPLFASLSRDDLAAIAAECSPHRIDDGRYLFHADQPADRLYLVEEGVLEVVRIARDRGAEVLLNTVGEGGLVGELAIVRGETRSASVRAKGPALVQAIEAQAFHQMLRRWPQIAIALARASADRLIRAEQRGSPARPSSLWVVVAERGLGPEHATALAEAAVPWLRFDARPRLVEVFAEGAEAGERLVGGALVRTRPSAAGGASALREAREQAALVVVAGPRSSVEQAARGADGLVSRPGAAAPPLPVDAKHVVLVDDGPVSAVRVRMRPWPQAAGRVARALLGRTVGLALGGGGALGFAHVGVLEVLEALGVPVDFIAGASMGAAMAGYYLRLGTSGARKLGATRSTPASWIELIDPSVITSGMLSGKRAWRMAAGDVGEVDIEQLPIPYAAVALDLDTGEEVLLREGSLPEAIRASISIPGLFVPHVRTLPGGRKQSLVDGGFVNNVPVDAVRAMGADKVIGVHVLGRRLGAGPDGQLGTLLRAALGLSQVARARTFALAQFIAMARAGERQVFTADVGLIPATEGFQVGDLWRLAEIAEAGRRVALDFERQLRSLGPSGPP